jgi:hypothetical protein
MISGISRLIFFSLQPQHSTEPLMIHSIQAAPEETFLVRPASGETEQKSWDDDAIPQQLHVSRLPSGSLSLGPGQVAIVPITFLPRYPELVHNDQDSYREVNPPPLLSPTARADLIELVGAEVLEEADYIRETAPLLATPSQRRNNLDPISLPQGDEFEVSTTVLVDTSRGVVKLPITASSVRANSYGIPDTILFRHLDSIKGEETDDDGISDAGPKSPSARKSRASVTDYGVVLIDTLDDRPERAGDNETYVARKPYRDCYDLYLSNPSPDKELEISEVLISKPELMSVEFDPDRLLLTPDIIIVSTGPTQVVREWTEDGPMYLPPDSEDNYVATVCTAPKGGVKYDDASGIYLEEMSNWIDSGSPDRSLGFLQIRTDAETLFVSLEREDHQSFPEASLDQALLPSSSLATTESTPKTSTLLKAVPASINLQVFSTAKHAIDAKIGLQNKSPVPLRIMRVTLGMNTAEDHEYFDLADRIGLKMNIGIADQGLVVMRDTDESELRAFILPAASTMDEVLVLSCSVGLDTSFKSHDRPAFRFRGTIVLRGTMDTELSHKQWREELMKDPYKDSHLVLEVPYLVTILNGRVEVVIERSTHPFPQIWGAQPWDKSGRAISALFFPWEKFEIIDDPEDPLPTQQYRGSDEIGHDLRILTNIVFPLKLEGAFIDDGLPVETAKEEVDSLCKRFNVSLISVTNPPLAALKYPGFDELGYLSLHYSFRKGKTLQKRKKHHDFFKQEEHNYPITCYLNVRTSVADTGLHRVPLVIFPGQLDVSVPRSRPGIPVDNSIAEALASGDAESDVPVYTLMGFDRLLTWVRTSVVGRALMTFLQSVVDDQKSLKSDANLLARYLLNICRRSPNIEDLTMRPILLKAGAIEHSEVIRSPLYLTNHNPIPITVTIEVGEVEGMSITLGRDSSRGRGDGSNMFDYLLRHLPEKRAIVKDGRYQGHPVDGLRQFLLSNEVAQEFSSRFPFRDAVSINHAAMARQPLLKVLYKWHSSVKFHSGPLPRRFQPEAESRCGGSMHPPLYNSFRTSDKRQLPGPFMISGDRRVARSLKVCWDRGMEKPGASDGTKVLIPPGGVARFDLRVRSPPQSLLENDISQLMATGLVLSTNYGEVMPIFATVEALQGQLHVSHPGEASGGAYIAEGDENADVNVIPVPLGLFRHTSRDDQNRNSTTLSIPPAESDFSSLDRTTMVHRQANSDLTYDGGVPLYLRSSFSREVRLLKVESCNPWFKVSLRESERLEYDRHLGINIGSVYSLVSCNEHNATDEYPSYYHCALNWLANRSELQPRGCGLLPSIQNKNLEDELNLDASHGHIDRAVRAFERVIRVCRKTYFDLSRTETDPQNSFMPFLDADLNKRFRQAPGIKSGTRRSDGIVGPLVLDIFAEAWDAWNVAAEYGARAISSSLRATIEYATSSGAGEPKDGVGRQTLALSMHNLAVETLLSTPKLFDAERAKQKALFASSSVDEESPSIIEFHSTQVGAIVSLTVPLRNPTSIPVRVRIAGARSASGEEKDELEYISTDKSLRNRFLQNSHAPYVQNGQAKIIQNENAQHLWWDGGGSYFVADERGDVVRSHHNISIRAGAGACVSLINPSLHASSAFLVGCGIRCAIRDDPKAKADDAAIDPKHSSPIGAAAAAGITLLGRKRSNLPQANALWVDEPNVHAGGSALPGSGGPAAFAVPYSALDEIIIPPFGVAEVGPIFFRPPGRFRVLGCESAIESGANHWGVETAEACKSQLFESMILLENSLTGLERVSLRGKGLWERVYFLDPPPGEGSDAFGDIEFRNGLPTLVFAGTSTTYPRSVVKEVLFHNGGDVAVDIAHVYFTDAGKAMDTRWPQAEKASRACRFGAFRLLNCWDSVQSIFEVRGEHVQNLRAGFLIEPGESRSLFVEHIPDCAERKEFVTLRVEHRRENPASGFFPVPDPGVLSLSRSGEIRSSKASEWARSFRSRKVDLLVGFEMSEDDFGNCVPAEPGTSRFVIVGEENASTRARESKRLLNTQSTASREFVVGRSTLGGVGRKLLSLLLVIILLMSTASLLTQFWFVRKKASESFRSTLCGPRIKVRGVDGVSSQQTRNVVHTNWQAAFRCLARADPTSIELQTLGREQIRQVIMSQYRARGVMPPQCFNSAGVFSRDRGGASGGNATRPRTGKEGVGSNERIRTLSDAIFQKLPTAKAESVRSQLPAGLGWRTAFARGIFDESTISKSSLQLRTRALLRRRNRDIPAALSVDGHSEEPTYCRASSSDGAEDHTDQLRVKDTSGENHDTVDGSGDVLSTSDSEGTEPKLDCSVSQSLDDKDKASSERKAESQSPVVSRKQQMPTSSNGEKDAREWKSDHGSRKKLPPDFGSRKSGIKKVGADKNDIEPNVDLLTPKATSGHKEKPLQSDASKDQRAARGSADSPQGMDEVGTGGRKKKLGKSERAPKASKQHEKSSAAGTKQRDPKSKSSPPSSLPKHKSASGKKKEPPQPIETSSDPITAAQDSPSMVLTPSAGLLRPPPGLAPPPGFNQDSPGALPPPGSNRVLSIGASGDTSLGPMLTAALNHDASLGGSAPASNLPFAQVGAARSDLLFSRNVRDTGLDLSYETSNNPVGENGMPLLAVSSPTIGSMVASPEAIGIGQGTFGQATAPAESSTPLIPLLGEAGHNSQNGFDVMDFLDSILNDGSAGDTEQDGAAGPGSLLADVLPNVPLVANPWASDGGRSSRAAAYGIAFDYGGEGDLSPIFGVRASTPTDDGFGNIPLLTPAAILLAGQDDNEDDRGSSFYASLMADADDE